MTVARTKAGKIRRRVSPGATVTERLELHRRVNKRGCWVWTASLSQGYGVLTYEGKRRYAHRMSWEQFRGPIPAGLEVDHLCRNRACFNPDHLEPVTPQENVRRGVSYGANAIRNGACTRGHDRETWGVPTGPRVYCRLCRVAYLRAYNDFRKNNVAAKPDLDAIFRSKRQMQKYGLVGIRPEDVLDNTPGAILASHRYPSLAKELAA